MVLINSNFKIKKSSLMKKICVVGLGYVGLPLAVAFSRKFNQVFGFEINKARVLDLKNNIDKTREVSEEELNNASQQLHYTSEIDDINDCNIFIVTVPTPITKSKTPDLNPLISATKIIGSILKKGDYVIYESTVYPGCTQEICIPILEEKSSLKLNNDFKVGYSPERIVPGDKEKTLTKITKVVSGSDDEATDFIHDLYAEIIDAGVFKAESIQVAEACKAIENAQRDLNISFMNELAIIFDKLNIDTLSVIEAAATKWNFLPYKPGLVGGHCISVDPYYLTFKAQSVGYHPEVILSGRRINDMMSTLVANKLIKMMIESELQLKGASILILGITFKENCPDIRNSKVIDVYNELKQFGFAIDVYDYEANPDEVLEEFGLNTIKSIEKKYDGILISVPHKKFLELDYNKLKKNESSIIFDLKGLLPRNLVNARL